MKKFFMFAAMASVALASCVKNEGPVVSTNDQDAIVFATPVVGNATKGEEIRGTVFPTTADFDIYAYYHVGNFDGTGETYMDEVECDYVGGNVDDGAGEGTWKNENDLYYWPKNGKLTFIAASPSESAVQAACAYTIASTSNTLTLGYTSPKAVADTAKQVDLLYSDWAVDRVASTHESNTTYDGAELVFNHALSVVRLNIQAKDKASSEAIRLSYLAIEKINEKGTFTSTWNAAGTTADWVYTDPVADYVIVDDANATTDSKAPTAVLTYPANADETNYTKYANYILMPQTFSVDAGAVAEAPAAQIKIEYWIKNGTKWTKQQHIYNLADAANKDSKDSPVKEWKESTRYTYNITIGVDEVYFAPVIKADWTDVEVNYDNEARQE